jgi:predicted dehydrogenase
VQGEMPEWISQLRVPDELVRPVAPYAAASKAFLHALESGSTGRPGASEALAAHRLVDAAYSSAAASGAPFPVA